MLTYKHSIFGGGVEITFSEKPPANILSALKANSFRWNRHCWWRRRVAGTADFFGWLDRELRKLSGKPDGECHNCHNPQGLWRQWAARTYLLCDACWKATAAELERSFGASDRMASDSAVALGNRDAEDTDDPMGVDAAYEESCRTACGL